MHRALAQPERGGGLRGGVGDRLLDWSGQTGGRYVDGLLEIWTVKRIGLVEDREDAQTAADEQAFQRDLAARNEVLDEDLSGAGIVGSEVGMAYDVDNFV